MLLLLGGKNYAVRPPFLELIFLKRERKKRWGEREREKERKKEREREERKRGNSFGVCLHGCSIV